jgi:hypothetical protein
VFAGALALAPELGAGDPVAPLDPVALLDAVAWAEELAPVLGAPLVALPEAALLEELADVGGVWVGSGRDVDEDGEHPATATVRMAKTPKPVMASFALSTAPVIVPRTVM